MDNTQNQALYVLDDTAPRTSPESGVDLHAALARGADAQYTARQAAPFAVLDTVISGIERLCEARPAVSLPPLDVNWSPRNSPFGTMYNPASGAIGSPHYNAGITDEPRLELIASA